MPLNTNSLTSISLSIQQSQPLFLVSKRTYPLSITLLVMIKYFAKGTTKNASFGCVFLSGIYKNAAIDWL